MISIYFGVPGCGKTTVAAKMAKNAVRHYDNVYTNFANTIPGVTVIDNICVGRFNLDNSLIIIDEATQFADNRDFKSFAKPVIKFLNEHRHHHCDMVYFVQKWDAVDIKIRTLCTHVYLIKKSILLPFLSYTYLIPYGIDFVNPKKEGHKFGEIIMGYCKPSLFSRIFKGVTVRPLYYKYFDSWECELLPPLPASYKMNPYPEVSNNVLFRLYRKLRTAFSKR